MKVGLTGHQELMQAGWVRSQLENLAEKLLTKEGFCSLAIGADQLWAQVLEQRSIPFNVIVPCRNYEKTFSQTHIDEYRRLLSLAATRRFLSFVEPSQEAFFEAGKSVVKESDLMLAVWNGRPSKGLGGTADIVTFAKQVGKTVIQINPVTCVVEEVSVGS